MNKLKTFLKWATHTKLGWLLTSAVWSAIFLIIDSNIYGDWAFYAAMPGLVYIAGLILVLIAFAWVINPIRAYKERRK